jgi:adenylylsulfate kinase
MSEQKANHITWHEGEVTRADRAGRLGQRGATLWFTGLSGSGKSTVAVALEKALVENGHLAYRLDGDNVRHGLNRNLGFSPEDRSENIRRIAEVAKLFSDAGVIAITSFISPYKADRDNARQLHEQGELPFYEIHVACPLDEAERRDPKGLYKKARAGEIQGFTGIYAPYEAPANPALHLRSDQQSLQEEVQAVYDLLSAHGVLSAPA